MTGNIMSSFKGLKKIRIGFLSTIYHTSFILMFNGWIEEKLKIKIEWELYGTGPSIIEDFIKKKLDIGYIGLPPTLIGIDKGATIKCVAGGHVEGTLMVAHNYYRSFSEVNRSIKLVLEQFKGKVIGVPRKGSIHDIILRNEIEKFGLSEIIQVKNYDISDFMLVDMQDNVVDAAVGTPALAILLNQHLNTKIIISPANWWPYNPSYGIIVSEFLIDNYPEVIEIFVELHKDACKLLREKPKEVAKLVETEVGLFKENFILETFKISPKYCSALPEEYVNSTMKFVKILRKLGYIEKKIGKSEIFNFSFIKKVHPEKHHYNIGLHL